MSHEYLVASLPLLFFGDPPPFSVALFRERCSGPLSPEALQTLGLMLEGRAVESNDPFAVAWAACETQLRNEIAQVRATRQGVDAKPFQRLHEGFRMRLHETVADAFEKTNSLEREQELSHGRWRMLDELVGQDCFGLAAVLAYGMKLRIAERWVHLTEEAGEERLEAYLQQGETKDTSAEAAEAPDTSSAETGIEPQDDTP